MSYEFVIGLGRQAVETMLAVSLPILLVTLVIGLAISIFQSVTQIQEMTLTVVPKIVVTFVCILLFGSWMLNKMVDFLRDIIVNIPFWTR
jgi:flagellar biosynthetic protein FliQ